MGDLIDLIYVEGNLLLTFVHLFVLSLSIDCIFGVAQCIGTLKRSVM